MTSKDAGTPETSGEMGAKDGQAPAPTQTVIPACHAAFLEVWAERSIPSQDNEGYVPDRGGFKSGFYAAWRYLMAVTPAVLSPAIRNKSNSAENRIAVLEKALDWYADPINWKRGEFEIMRNGKYICRAESDKGAIAKKALATEVTRPAQQDTQLMRNALAAIQQQMMALITGADTNWLGAAKQVSKLILQVAADTASDVEKPT